MNKFINEWKPAIFNTFVYVLFAVSLTFLSLGQIILLFVLGMICTVLGNSILLHRYYTHQQFKLSKWVEYLLLPFAILLGIGSPLMYATMHRQHHRVCDSQGDPHSPSKLGKWSVFLGIWEFYPTSYFKGLNAPLAKDLFKIPLQKFIHIHYYTIWSGMFLATSLIDWKVAVAIFGFIPVYQKVFENFIVNGICHPGPDILDWPKFGILTGGESMQKFHHDNPNIIKYSNNWLVDPSYLLIKVIKK